MSDTTQAVLAAALSLSEGEREELVDRLLESLPSPQDGNEMTDEEFHTELQRRAQEALDGKDPGVPWTEVKAMLLQDINANSHR